MRALAAAAAMMIATSGGAHAQTQGTPIEAAGPQGPLAGTFVDAGAGAPVMLIIPGSGPTDRDGNGAAGMNAGSYRLLAEALAGEGVSTVRIDKRGMFGSKAAIPDANAVTIADYAADVRSWIAAIRVKTHARCVWVGGHSEGGLVALVAGQQPADICGLVLITAAGRPLGPIIREQLQTNPANAPILPQALAALDSLEAGKTVDVSGMHPVLAQGLFSPRVQPYMIDLLRQRPAELAAKVRVPMLIVSGGRDLQIAPADAAALKAAAPTAETLALPAMNHVLKQVDSDDRMANVATYANGALPLMPGLAAGIARFIRTHAGH